LLPIVPMFHVNGWTIPFMCAMLGAKLVLPGKDLDAASLHEIMKAEGVTFAAGVPTVWQQLLGYLNENDLLLPDLKRVMVGGSAAPRIMIETFKDGYDIDVMHAWGMTETTSMGTSPSLSAKVVRQGADSMLTAKMMQGRSYFGLEMKLMDDAGNELPKDGEASGHLYIRGWAVASEYLGAGKTEEFTEDGWFSTGDIATLTPDGYLRLTDRAKDLIKSGGEWISSIDLENAAMAHPSIKQAAVIAIPHPKWDERPLLIAVPEGAPPSKSELLKFLSRSVAKWWLPDEVVFQAELPLGATGKVDKKLLRENYWA
ncbi:MAG: AMP-binding protein, partial [Pseudomonadota bacterium]